MINFRIPIGPSINGMYLSAHRNSKFGKTLSPVFKAWTKEVRPMIKRQWESQGKPLNAKHWGCRMVMGLNYKSDLDGRCKAMLDMLGKTIPDWCDDRWCDQIILERGGDKDWCEIEVYSLNQ